MPPKFNFSHNIFSYSLILTRFSVTGFFNKRNCKRVTLQWSDWTMEASRCATVQLQKLRSDLRFLLSFPKLRVSGQAAPVRS